MEILILDDGLPSIVALTAVLEAAGYAAQITRGGLDLLQALKQRRPALVLLAVAWPQPLGFPICRAIRRVSDVPVIFIAGHRSMPDCVRGLQIGGDDYLIDPVAPEELLARVEAVLRRQDAAQPRTPAGLCQGDFTLNPVERTLLLGDGHVIALTQIEFRLLHYLMQNSGRVLKSSQLLIHVWGYTNEGGNNALASYIMRLRKKIEPDPAHPIYLITVRKLGYTFDARGIARRTSARAGLWRGLDRRGGDEPC